MPSKNGFGNSRTPLNRKAQYGVDQKNPIMMKSSPAKLFGSKKRKERNAMEDANREKVDELLSLPMNYHLSEEEKRAQAESMLGQ
jgi:hypothetical protein